MTTEFLDMLRHAVDQAGSQRKLADALGLSEHTISRVLQGTGYAFSVKNCFRLAKFLGGEPVDVLRAAGKTDLADSIDEAYGRPVLTFAQRTLLADFDALEPDLQKDLRSLISRSARRERERRERPRRRPRA